MAKPRKPGTTRSTRAQASARLKSTAQKGGPVEDAEVVKETKPDETPPLEAAATDKAAKAADAKEPSPKPSDDTRAGDAAPEKAATDTTDAGAVKVTDSDTAETGERSPGTAAETSPDADASGRAAAEERPHPSADLPQPVAIAAEPPPRRGGFFPMLLGGVVAAALGAGVLYYADREGWVSLGEDTTDLEAKIGALEEEIAVLRSTEPDLSAVNARIDDLAEEIDGVSEAAASLRGRLDATDARLDQVATEPIPEARLPEQVTAAYEAKFAELQTAFEARVSERLAAMEVAQGAAAAAQQAAAQATLAAERRAALAEIDVALDTGASFGDALAALEDAGTEVPATLRGVADGSAATLADLQSSFPVAARAALVASTRAEAEDGSVDRLTAFMRTQLGARSLEPRAGNDPDAILSRAEAAVGRGDLQSALDEIATLPEAGQAELSDWTARAQTRIEAVTALGALITDLDSN